RIFTNHLITPFPKPTGPYAVGTFSRLATDPSRTNRYDIPNNSSFMVQFWYPAEAKAGVLPAAYVEPEFALVPGETFCVGTDVVTRLVSHALLDVPLATNETSYPVL